jgi:ATP-dependent Clp protease ATP-binding subunit ClpA
VIQKQLVDRLATALLRGEIHAGDVVSVGVAGGELVLETAGAEVAGAQTAAAV